MREDGYYFFDWFVVRNGECDEWDFRDGGERVFPIAVLRECMEE